MTSLIKSWMKGLWLIVLQNGRLGVVGNIWTGDLGRLAPISDQEVDGEIWGRMTYITRHHHKVGIKLISLEKGVY